MVLYSQIEQCTALRLGSTCHLFLLPPTESHELWYLLCNNPFHDGADHEALQLASRLLPSLEYEKDEPHQGENLLKIKQCMPAYLERDHEERTQVGAPEEAGVEGEAEAAEVEG